ncbi:uncharacterized protein CELE_Y7A5A.2 [Caenorhabditis elegans]|uniref:Uncharacterized protein n=1 Tax=Caenorhabditis elegans TaxID=6239 RepID=Q9XVZ1_CAEEL|nr:Uncharacterized protein CELE_Y7A5A.2 [Caenorhabditis elegans]CAA22462.1 Uncharacterized protein CELE_Y7A5A.2 [Caenorhabditis elegans]|eukprot:NP_510595.1 Uncharacterized protein CELE_Y7A5A.2 [Caenorhabditis elegans]
MTEEINDRYQIPKHNFFTPEDATTWAVIHRARFWNDRFQDLLDSEKVLVSKNVPFKVLNEYSSDLSTKCLKKCEAERKENILQQIQFSEVLQRHQKPNLFGNSIVSLRMLNSLEMNEVHKKALKREMPKLLSSENDQNLKRRKE